ncbi:MAG TPA: DinB family protein [Candidatus Solibacter sp.]|jgi:hypothetical protein|nr:DinB family protein [Candidatus Solibacter sp.]
MADPRPLTPAEAARVLAASGASITAGIETLPEEIAGWHSAPDEWCVKECLGHIVEAEGRGFAGRIRQILEKPGLSIMDWNQVEVQKQRGDDGRALADLVGEFASIRAESVQLVEGLQEEDLAKSCEHNFVGTLRVQDLLHEWIHHDQNHHRQMQANLQAYVWQSMGNAQRFSQPH